MLLFLTNRYFDPFVTEFHALTDFEYMIISGVETNTQSLSIHICVNTDISITLNIICHSMNTVMHCTLQQ